jgi:hypothetical protein
MAILHQNISYNNSRFPRPKTRITQPNVFPSDLNIDGRGFYTKISFKNYNFLDDVLPDTFSGGLGGTLSGFINGIISFGSNAVKGFGYTPGASSFTPSLEIGDIILPIPKKINDNFTFSWNDQSVLEKVAKLDPTGRVAFGTSAIATSSFMTGVTINPFLFMFFQRPNFKEFVLQWTLTPNTPKESETVNKIVDSLQKASLPTKTGFGFLLKYPHVLEIKLYPQEFGDQMMFKMCAITSVQVDYTGAGSPSFFKGTNLPTVMTLSLSLKEIELWDSSEIEV